MKHLNIHSPNRATQKDRTQLRWLLRSIGTVSVALSVSIQMLGVQGASVKAFAAVLACYGVVYCVLSLLRGKPTLIDCMLTLFSIANLLWLIG